MLTTARGRRLILPNTEVAVDRPGGLRPVVGDGVVTTVADVVYHPTHGWGYLYLVRVGEELLVISEEHLSIKETVV